MRKNRRLIKSVLVDLFLIIDNLIMQSLLSAINQIKSSFKYENINKIYFNQIINKFNKKSTFECILINNKTNY